MTDPKKPLEVVFAPGCFDHLDVADQAELDSVMKEITEMFASMTPEELAAQSRPVDWDSLDEEERRILEQSLNDEPRNLQ
jgi:hypothetical protein